VEKKPKPREKRGSGEKNLSWSKRGAYCRTGGGKRERVFLRKKIGRRKKGGGDLHDDVERGFQRLEKQKKEGGRKPGE